MPMPTDPDTERGLRAANLAISDVRDQLHRLAAQVVALIDEVGRRTGAPIADAVDAAAARVLEQIEVAIERTDPMGRLHLATELDKYAIAIDDAPPCEELLPVCEARCCRLPFPLSTQDLDERVIRWDYGRPYLIAHAGGTCVHNDADRRCTAYAHRPAACRRYDCRNDPRIWTDYAARIPAPLEALAGEPPAIELRALVERAAARRVALAVEASALRDAPEE
jgi:hypothetical protein